MSAFHRCCSPAIRYSPDEKSGAAAAVRFIEQKLVDPAASKMKYCFGHLALVEAIPCSNEVRGSKAYKRKTGTHLLLCTSLAIQT